VGASGLRPVVDGFAEAEAEAGAYIPQRGDRQSLENAFSDMFEDPRYRGASTVGHRQDGGQPTHPKVRAENHLPSSYRRSSGVPMERSQRDKSLEALLYSVAGIGAVLAIACLLTGNYGLWSGAVIWKLGLKLADQYRRW
jgi:hypothetical protein